LVFYKEWQKDSNVCLPESVNKFIKNVNIMKQQIKAASPAGRKLSLGKKTISNLSVLDMKKIVGRYWTIYYHGA
jgi:hypothetical protein